MILLPSAVRIFLCTRPTDMRKSFDSLTGLVQECFGQDPLTGHLFLFVNRRGDRIKILYFDRDGLALWYKKQASDYTRSCPFTGNLGHTDNRTGRPLTAGGVGSHQESSRARRRPMSRNVSVLAPPRAHRISGPRRSIVSGVC
jgi:IS66 Orf2 like protein